MSTEGIKRVLSESLLLAVVPVIGTLICFAFECGYVSTFYGIPVELVQVDVIRVAWVSLIIGIVMVPLGGVYSVGVLLSLAPSRKVRLIGGIVVGVIVLVAFGPPTWWFFSFLVVCLLLNQIPPPRTLERSDIYIGAGLLVLACGIFAMGVASGLGTLCAGFGYAHYVLDADETVGDLVRPQRSFLLVRRYGTDYVFREVDLERAELRDGIEIRSSQVERVRIRRIPVKAFHSYKDSRSAEEQRSAEERKAAEGVTDVPPEHDQDKAKSAQEGS